jgi:alpha-L-rhamnosidase
MKTFVMKLTIGFCIALAAAGQAATVTSPQCEYRTDPLGIGVEKPRLSWVILSGKRGEHQTAYRILVASSAEKLANNQGDRWDSGKVLSDQTIDVEYGGSPLESGQPCYWKVQVWASGSVEPSATSEPALWTMGLLRPADWTAQWIGYDAVLNPPPEVVAERKRLSTSGLKWVRYPESKTEAQATQIELHTTIKVPVDREIQQATLVLYPDNQCNAAVNGTKAGQANRWSATTRLDVTRLLHAGDNKISLAVSNSDNLYAAVEGKLVVQFKSGDDLSVPIDHTWMVTRQGPENDVVSAAEMKGTPWGSPALNDAPRPPAPYLRKDFLVGKPIRRATVYATALGLYELHLNGKKVGDAVLTPGWTDYLKRVDYQTYDVTSQVKTGPNAIGAILGQGWYAGCIAFTGKHNFYGGNPRFMAQLVIELADGTTQTIATDGTWKASYGPVRYSDLLLGSEIDSRLAMPGWDDAGFNDHAWTPVTANLGKRGQTADVTARVTAALHDDHLSVLVDNDTMGGDPAKDQVKGLRVEYRIGDDATATETVAEHATLKLDGSAKRPVKIERATYGLLPTVTPPRVEAAVAAPSREFEHLPALKLTEPKPGLYTFDLGQNMVGWARLHVHGTAGQRLTVRYGEMLNPDGTLYAANLRGATATDFFILNGSEQVLEPKFTFHGFRYVEVRGLDAKPELDAVTGIVVHSEITRTGSFECSNALVNQLYHNIIWGQKGNYVEVPTDCPQRDERAGWTGDTQFFIKTAAYNCNVDPFFTRWLTTICEDSQHADGSFAHVAPDLGIGSGSTAWGDAALLCTYRIYQDYGDKRVIAAHFPAMQRYMQFVASKSNHFIPNIGGFGDWLNLGGGASREVIDTAYYAHLADIMSRMAAAIGKTSEADAYAKLHQEVKNAFAGFFEPDGSIKDSSQTGYALAFTMGLVPDELRDKAIEQYSNSVKKFDWHLATGFIGTPRLLPGLHDAGLDDVAYRVLMQETYPSWLFQVKLGATTMWERWDGWTPDRGFQTIGMNSFNHYAFGAVGEYLYGVVGGIAPASPAYKTIRIAPVPGKGITWTKTTYDSVRGPIACDWKLDAGKLTMNITVPVNTTAIVELPTNDPGSVTESGKPAADAEGVKTLQPTKHAAVFEVQSGNYAFVATEPRTE